MAKKFSILDVAPNAVEFLIRTPFYRDILAKTPLHLQDGVRLAMVYAFVLGYGDGIGIITKESFVNG